jgi:hypothetical protein
MHFRWQTKRRLKIDINFFFDFYDFLWVFFGGDFF